METTVRLALLLRLYSAARLAVWRTCGMVAYGLAHVLQALGAGRPVPTQLRCGPARLRGDDNTRAGHIFGLAPSPDGIPIDIVIGGTGIVTRPWSRSTRVAVYGRQGSLLGEYHEMRLLVRVGRRQAVLPVEHRQHGQGHWWGEGLECARRCDGAMQGVVVQELCCQSTKGRHRRSETTHLDARDQPAEEMVTRAGFGRRD